MKTDLPSWVIILCFFCFIYIQKFLNKRFGKLWAIPFFIVVLFLFKSGLGDIEKIVIGGCALLVTPLIFNRHTLQNAFSKVMVNRRKKVINKTAKSSPTTGPIDEKLTKKRGPKSPSQKN